MHILLKSPMDSPVWYGRLRSMLSADFTLHNSIDQITQTCSDNTRTLSVHILSPQTENKYRGTSRIIADCLDHPDTTLVIALIRNRSNTFTSAHLWFLTFLAKFLSGKDTTVVTSMEDGVSYIEEYFNIHTEHTRVQQESPTSV